MDTELNQLIAFMDQLKVSKMGYKDIVARGYDYALLLCRSREEHGIRSDREIPTLLQVYTMDHAADLLKAAISKQSTAGTIEYEHDGKLYKGTVYEVSNENPVDNP